MTPSSLSPHPLLPSPHSPAPLPRPSSLTLQVVVAAAMPPGLFVTAGLDTYMSVGYQLMFPSLSDIGAYLMIFPGQLGDNRTTHLFSHPPFPYPSSTPSLPSHPLSTHP